VITLTAGVALACNTFEGDDGESVASAAAALLPIPVVCGDLGRDPALPGINECTILLNVAVDGRERKRERE
jgi:hypothetical protein